MAAAECRRHPDSLSAAYQSAGLLALPPLSSILHWRPKHHDNCGDALSVLVVTLTGDPEDWQLKPSGTEGYRTAEVTLCGVDTDHLSSKTMECKTQPGLYFVGEVMDVTGHLGGYNFQWAWASGHAAGQYV